MISLSHLSVIRFSGPDAAAFLHNQFSADIRALDEGESTWACYCEPKGRVLALMLVSALGGDYFVVLSSSLAQQVEARLKIYIMRSNVETRIADDITLVGLDCTDTKPAAPTLGVPGTDTSLVMLDSGKAPAADKEKVSEWKLRELKSGICWLNQITSGQFLPQMLGYDALGAVNFKKGCYPGQEIVARTHYLGKVKRHPRVLPMDTEPAVSSMDSIYLEGGGATDKAVVVDWAGTKQSGYCILVVSRIDPEIDLALAETQ